MIAGLLLLTALGLFAVLFIVGILAVQAEKRTGRQAVKLGIIGQWLFALIFVTLFAAGFVGIGYLVGVLRP